jgi:hypothetical protein
MNYNTIFRDLVVNKVEYLYKYGYSTPQGLTPARRDEKATRTNPLACCSLLAIYYSSTQEVRLKN